LREDRIGRRRWLLRAWVAALPLGYLATDLGWSTREVGRFPYFTRRWAAWSGALLTSVPLLAAGVCLLGAARGLWRRRERSPLREETWRDFGGLQGIPPYVEDTGEVNWLVSDALHLEVPIPVIRQAVMKLFASRDVHQYWARAIAMMRRGFGGHPFGPDEAIVRERREGRVGPYPRAAEPGAGGS
jgi:hypothetical protein